MPILQHARDYVRSFETGYFGPACACFYILWIDFVFYGSIVLSSSQRTA